MKIQIEYIDFEDNLTNEKSLKSPKSPIFSKTLGNTGKINIFEPIQ